MADLRAEEELGAKTALLKPSASCIPGMRLATLAMELNVITAVQSILIQPALVRLGIGRRRMRHHVAQRPLQGGNLDLSETHLRKSLLSEPGSGSVRFQVRLDRVALDSSPLRSPFFGVAEWIPAVAEKVCGTYKN